AALDLNNQNYTASSNWELVSYTVQQGDTVTLTGYGAGTTPGAVYQYSGPTTTLDLNNQNYATSSNWQQVGSVTVTASENAIINASGSSAAVAISGGGIAVAIAGAGVGITNTILDTTEAYIRGSKVTAASDVDVSTIASATIDATVLAISVSAAAGLG